MSKKKGTTGLNLIDHLHEMRNSQISKRLGVTFHIFENNDLEEQEELDETTEYGYDAKQEVGHEKRQGKQKAMQSIDEPTGVQAGSRDPGLRKKGGNKHKEKGMGEGLSVGGSKGSGAAVGCGMPDMNNRSGDSKTSLSPTSDATHTQKTSSRRDGSRRPSEGKYSIGNQNVKADIDGIKENEELDETTEYGCDAKQEVGHEKRQGKQEAMQSIDEPTGVQAGSRDPGLRKKGGNKYKEKGMKENSLNEAVNRLVRTIRQYRKQNK